jgi:hypothetical protein
MNSGAYFLSKAAQCRRLAETILSKDDPAIPNLLALAAEFERRAILALLTNVILAITTAILPIFLPCQTGRRARTRAPLNSSGGVLELPLPGVRSPLEACLGGIRQGLVGSGRVQKRLPGCGVG